MSDIVERLRDLATYPQPPGRKQIMANGADEIERLRWQRDEQDKDILASSRLLADYGAEIRRLGAIRDDLVEALDVLLRYVDETAEDGMMQCVETQMARDAIAKAKGENK
jgi:hypothetical protein